MEEKFRKYLQRLATRADNIVREELASINANFGVAQVYAYDQKRVGVRGDQRVEGYPVELTFKGIKRNDGAYYTQKEFYGFLDKVSTRIGNEIEEIVGVIWTTTHKNLDGSIWSIEEEIFID